jgi:RNA polymerase sigma-70 factor, ECF subfamily
VDPERDAEDLAAVSAVLRGDSQAYRRIVEWYGSLVLRLCMDSLGNREDAQEAVQEIFLRTYRALRGFRLDRRFLPWLYGIALNHLRSAYAKSARFKEKNAKIRGAAATAEPEGDPVSHAEDEDARHAVREAVAALPDVLREPVILYYFEGLRIEDVADALGIGTENVKSRLFRARKRLKTILEIGATGGREREYTDGEA